MTLSGKARIAGNRAGSANSNLYLLNDGTVSAAGLTAGAGIGVSTQKEPGEINVAVTSDAVSANYFTSDDSSYETMLTGGPSPNRVGLTQRSKKETHSHSCVCGQTHTAGNGHTESVSLTNWVGVSDLNLITGAGNYYLTGDVTLTEAIAYDSGAYCGWKAPDGVVLCLNGHDITMQNPVDLVYESGEAKNEDVILVTGRFTLTDCTPGIKQGRITHETNKVGRGMTVLGGTFDMYGGQITGNTTTKYGTAGGVLVKGEEDAASSTTFNLYGGSINGNQSGYGGGVYVSRVVWEGASQFNMYGGSITGNTSTVTDDTSSYGIGGGVCVSWTAAFKMTGGTITDNTAKFDGAGVYLSALARSSQYDTGEQRTAKFEISGSPNITGNKVNGAENNVYLDTDTTASKYAFNETVDASITILDGLSSTARIGVTAKKTPTEGNRVLVATGAHPEEDYSSIFTSDNADYEVQERNDNTLKLAVKGDPSADSAKATQSALNITGDSTVTYGHTLRLTAEGGTTKNAVKWSVEDTNGSATIDENGVLTPINAGTVTVTAIMPGNDTYADVSATRTVTINEATVVITALNKRAYVGSIVPALPETPVEDTDYTVDGLIGDDKLIVLPTLKYVDAEGNEIVPDMTKVNNVMINISDATASDNYKINFVEGKLVITNRPSSGGGSTTYSVSTPGKVENGTVTVSHKSASKGNTVTITVTPDSGYQLDKLTVTDINGDEQKLTDQGNGKYTFTMPAGKVEINTVFAEEAETNPFRDVSANDYCYEAVKWAAENEITGGIGNDLFGPDQPCTRAQIVTFLWRAAGSPESRNTSSFSDVPADSYYAEAVAWAVENGITTGTDDGKFSPEATCTRAQSVTFLCRAVGKPVEGEAAFSDVSDDSYYANAVAWAVKNNVTNGVAEGMFGPDNSCTRAQIVTFLYRTYQG